MQPGGTYVRDIDPKDYYIYIYIYQTRQFLGRPVCDRGAIPRR